MLSPFIKISSLRKGDYVCNIYNNDGEFLNPVTEYITSCLVKKGKVLYISSQYSKNILIKNFQKFSKPPNKLNINYAIAAGSIEFIEIASFKSDSKSCAVKFNEIINNKIKSAVTAGFDEISLIGEMSWILNCSCKDDFYFYKESEIKKFFSNGLSSAFFCYDRNLFKSEFILKLLECFPLVMVKSEIFENIFYIPFNNDKVKDVSALVDYKLDRLFFFKKSKRRLINSESRLKLALEAANEAIWDWDIVNNKLYWNNNYYKMLGYDSSDMQASIESLERLLTPEDVEINKKKLEDYLKNFDKKLYESEMRLKIKNGGYKWILVKGSVVKTDNNGRALRMIGTHVDIDNQKELEKKYSLLFNKMIDGFALHEIICDETGKPIDYRFIEVNPAFEALTGLKYKEIAGKRVLEVLPETESYWIDIYGKIALEGGSVRFDNYSAALDKHFEVIAFSPEKRKFAVIFVDITERKRIEKELIAARKKAEEASAAKSIFLANMSHEIRTPMNGVMGFASLLASSGLNGQQMEFLDFIKLSAGHLLEIINDILDFSKIEAGRLKLSSEKFDICALIENTINLLTIQSERKNLKFFYSIDLNIDYLLIGDPVRIKQIIINLLSNAIKFTEKGFIKISVTEIRRSDDSALLKISVEDSGIGISEEKLGCIFESFNQLDSSFNKKYAGAGLGLAIVKSLVELMGGSVNVKSQIGRGTTFELLIKFKIGCREASLYQVDIVNKNEKPFQINKDIKILLVEDDHVSRELIKALLKRKNIASPDIAVNGVEAAKIFESVKYDLIMMDIQIPGIDGLQLIKLIKSSNPEYLNYSTPIIAITAYAQKGDREKIIGAGADEYLSKPINDKDFTEVLNKIFAHLNIIKV